MKAVMTGQPVSRKRKLASAFQLFRLFRNRFFGNAEDEIRYHAEGKRIFAAHVGKPVEGARVLEIGSGQTAPLVALWLADGADAWGIDVEVPTHRLGAKTLISVLRKNGVERALKSFVRHTLFDRPFFAKLGELHGKPMPLRKLAERTPLMSATAMTWPDSSFDFIYSRNVFEHIDDVSKAVAEVNRVLAPGGVAWISLHLFPSLTGGHNLEWLSGDLATKRSVAPWDHLRENRHPAPVYLNRHTLREHERFFREGLDVVGQSFMRETLDPLTPELEAELAAKGWTRDDLLTRHVFFVCRKRAGSAVPAR